MLKQCRLCKEALPLAQFYPYKRTKDGYRNECKQCGLNYRKNNPDIKRRADLMAKFGITIEQYDEALALQGNKCGCCGIKPDPSKPRNFAVDHCHITGKLRGVLCHKCNTGIGSLGDNLDGIKRAIKYLEKFEGL